MGGIEVVQREAKPADATAVGGEIDRRIQDVMRVKRLCGALVPARERRFSGKIAKVRAEAASPSVATRAAAALELELLTLELCDD